MVSKLPEFEIVNKYLNGESNLNLSIEYKVHRLTIQRLLKKNGITLHKAKTKVTFNKKFFSSYTKESCYWAGFILADGYIRPNRNSLHIKLATIDRNHLVKFLKVINCGSDIVKDYSNYSSIDVHLDEYKQDLSNNFDITSNKTFSTTISEKIPNDLLNHFIRGYFDGDGCITQGASPIVINFVGTYAVLEKISSIGYNDLKIRLKSKNLTPAYFNKHEKYACISYSGKNAVKYLLWLYEDFTNETVLDRKWLKFKNCIDNGK